jgi:hypothetical protein
MPEDFTPEDVEFGRQAAARLKFYHVELIRVTFPGPQAVL